MSLRDDFREQMAQLRADVQNVTHTKLADGLLDAITNSATYRVYDVDFEPVEYVRRRSFEKKELYGVKKNGLSIEIEALQSGNPDQPPYHKGHIVDIVEGGGPWDWEHAKAYPPPRPFMEEGLKDYIDGGFADADLAEGLRARGYTVIE